jgi:iron complex outermembrane receptor protein
MSTECVRLAARKQVFLKLVMGATALGGWPGIAAAQDAARESPSADASDTEIVVTAQRRTERAQDVPIAIAAFSEAQVRELGATRLQDLVRSVPNVTLYDDRGAGQPTWVIRGVGLADFNPNNTPTAAVFQDDFYLPSNALAGVGLYDLERVEVLKGPQGGLYGRNTSGGAIRVESRKPVLGEVNGLAEASYGSYDSFQMQAALNVPLGHSLALRLSGTTDQGGGWQDSLATPAKDHWGDRDVLAGRAQLLFEPSDKFRVLLKVEGGRDKSETLLGSVIGTEDLTKPSAGTNVFCPALLAGHRDDSTCATFADRILQAQGIPFGPRASDESGDGRVVLSNPINKLDNDWLQLNGQISVDLGFATLQSITGKLNFDYRQAFDYDGTQLTLAHERSNVKFDVWSQELRLTSKDDGPFDWLVGGVYNYDKIDDIRDFFINDNLFVGGSLIQSFFRTYTQKTKAWSGYANAGYDLSGKVRVHGSLRYTDEKKRFYNASLFIRGFGIYQYQNLSQQLDLRNHWTGDLGLDFKPNQDLLLYIKGTKGYKSGGFFGGFPGSGVELLPYPEEVNWAYEAGAKATLPAGLRLNGAIFFYDYKNKQGYINQANPTPPGGTSVRLGSVGDYEQYGAEVELVWQPPAVPGLTLQFSPAYLKGEVKKSSAMPTTITGHPYALEGRPLNFPEWSFFALARYEAPLSDSLVGSVQANYAWRDSPNPSLRNAADDAVTYGIYHIPSYGSLDARIAVGNRAAGWEFSLEAKNLTDKANSTVVTRDSLGSFMEFYQPPRTFRARLRFDF